MDELIGCVIAGIAILCVLVVFLVLAGGFYYWVVA